MATELDHDVIKQKIVAILQANSTLYTTTGEDDKLRSIKVGEPTHKDRLPFAYITNSRGTFETVKTGVVIGNAIQVLYHTFQYNIVFMVQEKNSRKAEVMLDEFQKLIMQTLEADHNLTGAGTADVDDSQPLRVDPMPINPTDRSKGFKGRIVIFRCEKTTG